MLLSSISLALTRLGQRLGRWSPLALWPDGIDSPGMWISPSTLPASFNDYTGTTPVATPGTVADSANPVGLALDIRAGATALADPGNHMLQSTSAARPLESARVNLLTYTEDFENAIWAFDIRGSGTAVKTPNYTLAPDGTMTACRLQLGGVNASGDGAWLQCRQDIYSHYRKKSVWAKSNTANSYVMTMLPGSGGSAANVTVTPEWQRITYPALSQISWGFEIGLWFDDGTASSCDISIWHPQTEYGSTLTDYQSIPGNGSTYSATGITPFQLYDGVDDGMATASFAAGTLINGMDCMIAVRRDSDAATYLISDTGSRGFFEWESGDTNRPDVSAGTPTYYVDGVACTATRGALFTALTAGNLHILEARDLDLSAWTAFDVSKLASYCLNGARGDILLYPSTASTEDKDNARQWLADYYGVTLA